MYRSFTCGELRKEHVGKYVVLAGWVQKNRRMGGMVFIDLRDRYGITQLVANENTNKEIFTLANELGREFVIQAKGTVIERSSINANIATGDIEINLTELTVLNKADVPPFTIQADSDGGEELRMQYRYLDLRREPLQNNLILRHRMAKLIRDYLDNKGFIEVETPYLIKSTPEGARDFVVPSRIHHGEFYALPQSPQVFKQLLMVGGFDKYFQIVKCFRDEDFRSDRQPEFTQIDCEMSFVEQEDILKTFEGMMKYVLLKIKGIDFPDPFPRMTYAQSMEEYGNDKPDIRFEMKIKNLSHIAKGKGFVVFDGSEYIGGICAEGCSEYTRKQTDELTNFVKKPQIGAKGLVYVKYEKDGSLKSSVDKFYSQEDLKKWADELNAKPGDLLLILSGDKEHTLNALSELRLEMGNLLGLRDKQVFAPLWVVDFPLLEWDEKSNRFFAKHHPFTSPKKEDIGLLDSNPKDIRANAYDFVINGTEIGGGSIRIYDSALQRKMFELLNFTEEEANAQFGFLMNAFKYGAPPHGGIAFGFDRLTSILNGTDSIRDVIAFPKNNAGRDIMIDSPSTISKDQLNELNILIAEKKK